MSTINVHLPKSLYDTARELAEKEDVSIDQLVTLALAEKVSALMTEEILGARAKSGSKRKFRAALAKVPDRAPAPRDKL